MNALSLATRLSWVLDFIAMAVLAGTGEVRLEIFALAAALFLLSRSGFLKVPEKVTLGALVALVLTTFGAWFWYRFHPIVGAAYLAPLVHSVLFFAPETGRYRGWRIGIGFVQLILASALAPDAYLFPAIFAFVLIAAVTVSSAFLDSELSKRAPGYRDQPLPVGFIRNSLTLAFLIFLSSIIIFPILPRMKMGGGLSDSFKVGYTEHVELGEKKGLNGHEGTGETVLRLYSKGGVDLSREIFQGLIRGRSLDIFDGTNWISNSRRSKNVGLQFVKPSELKDAIWVEVDRAPLRTISLPVPYGTLQVQNGYAPGLEFMDSPYPRTVGGEWVDSQANDARVRFSFAFVPYQKHVRHISLDEDPPLSSDLSVPESLKTTRMLRLASTLFSKTKSDAEKVGRLGAFFQRESFSASLADAKTDPALLQVGQTPVAERLLPMERFLFLTKVGNCEWFASSSVLLLRMAGIPARLVSGFRISKGPVGGVLTITTNDAHAWVEYWTSDRGWTALDPTPRVLGPSGILNVFRDGYEWVSAYWYRYVLNFADSKDKTVGSPEFQPQSSYSPSQSPRLKALRTKLELLAQQYRMEMLLGIGLVLAIAMSLYLFMRWRYPWIFSIRHRVREGGPALRRERIRMERLVLKKTAAHDLDEAVAVLKASQKEKAWEVLKSWLETYQQLRFGTRSSVPEPKLIQLLRRQYHSVKEHLK